MLDDNNKIKLHTIVYAAYADYIMRYLTTKEISYNIQN